MIKKLSIAISCLLLMASSMFGQSGSFAWTSSSGTYNPNDSFTLTLNGTISGLTTSMFSGFSLWLQAPTASGFNTAISITSNTAIQFTDKNQAIYPKLFNDTSGDAEAGFAIARNGVLSGDLGSTDNGSQAVGNGTYNLGTYDFSLSGAAPGTYLLKSVVTGGRKSGLNDDAFAFYNAPQIVYTITVVPEPSTWSLVAVGALGAVGFGIRRRRRQRA